MGTTTWLDYAWVSPDGNVIPVDSYGGHDSVAYTLPGNPDHDTLITRGWLHLSIGSLTYGYSVPYIITRMHHRFTESQLNALWDIYLNKPSVTNRLQDEAIAFLRRVLGINESEGE